MISLGLSAGLGAANPACGGALTTPNPAPPFVTNPPPSDAGPAPDSGLGGRGGAASVTNPPPPDASLEGWDAAGGQGGLAGTIGRGGTGGYGGGNVFPPRPDGSGGSGGSSDADVVDGAADGGEMDGHEVD